MGSYATILTGWPKPFSKWRSFNVSRLAIPGADNMMDNLRVLILAAGKSTRMKSKYAKVLHNAAGTALIQHVVRAARWVSTDITLVIGHSGEKVTQLLPESRFVEQKE